MSLSHKIYKKAASLTEVMIVLGVISTVMVASVTIMINSMVRIRINEIEDAANSAMILALEITKSPANVRYNVDVDDSGLFPYDIPQYFSISNLEGNNMLIYRPGHGVMTACNGTLLDRYDVSFLLPEDISQNSVICIQVEVTPRRGINDTRIYEIVVRAIYEIPGGEVRSNVIQGFRY